MKQARRKGFVALASVIILSAILLVIAVVGGLRGFYARSDMLDAESKERSSALADGCADTVLARLANDPTYPTSATLPETIAIDGASCQIIGVQNPGGNPRIFQIQGVYGNAYTDIMMTVDSATLSIPSWQEVPHF